MYVRLIFIIRLLQIAQGTSMRKPSLDEVRSLIKKVREESDSVISSNIDLHSEIKRVQIESGRRIADYNIEKYNLSTEFKEEMDKLKILQANLSVLYQEEQNLSRKANRIKFQGEKLELGIKLLEEDIDQLESRRKKGEEEVCLKLLPQPKETKLKLRSTNASEEDEMIVLANELEEEKSRLYEVTNKHEELQMVLKDKKTLSNTAIANLESIIKEIDGDLSKAKVRVSIFEEKCENKKAKMASLREDITTDLKYIENKKENLESLRNNMIGFGKAIQCYNKLEEEIFHTK